MPTGYQGICLLSFVKEKCLLLSTLLELHQGKDRDI
jgi:hypothetical protein